MSNSELLLSATNSDAFTAPSCYPRDLTDEVVYDLDLDAIPYGKKAARRAIPLHDALAQILVSEPVGQVAAVGSAIQEDAVTGKPNLVIYLSIHNDQSAHELGQMGHGGSHDERPDPKAHLQSIWSCLREVWTSSYIKGVTIDLLKTSDSNVVVPGSIWDLYHRIYR